MTRKVAERGVKRFEDALPYLFGTCEDLGIVQLNIYDGGEIWVAGGVQSYQSASEIEARYREIEVQGGDTGRLLRTVSVNRNQNPDVSAITVLEQESDQTWSVREIGTELPRVFVQFPVADTETLPLGCVLNGSFEPAKERDALRFESSSEKLEAALRSISPLLKLGSTRGWRGLHRLALLKQPEASIGRGDEDDE